MLDWNEYIEQLLSQNSCLDSVKITLNSKKTGFPSIIKASILMLDRMQENQGKFNILVFPERVQSIFLFTLARLLYNISEGKIESAYDPAKFKKGEHLKLGDVVAEFLRVEKRYGKDHIILRLSDMETSAPIDFFPLFQKTTAKRLSKYKDFSSVLKSEKNKLSTLSSGESLLDLLIKHKTHMDSSVINMTSITSVKEQIENCDLFGRNLSTLLQIGQVNYKGEIHNSWAGQAGGIPAIVLASDLYSISELAQRKHPIQSIIIDGSNAAALLSQLDKLDELMRLGIPITCVTDTVNSFDLQPFLDRKFNLWRWDETSITRDLYKSLSLQSEHKIMHCSRKEVQYVISDGNEISTAFKLLSFHKNEAKGSAGQLPKMFEKLFSLAFAALRETVPFDRNQVSYAQEILQECSKIVDRERIYLSPQMFTDCTCVIECLRKVFTLDYILPKYQTLEQLLTKNNFLNVCIVVPDQCDTKRVKTFWQTWCSQNRIKTDIDVLHPGEYYLSRSDRYAATVVVCWMRRAIMKKILYSFITRKYIVFMYDYENSWKKYSISKWNVSLDKNQNRQIIEHSFNSERIKISTSRFATKAVHEIVPHGEDEYEQIETVLRENKYQQYVSDGKQKLANETVEAIPVNFVGGYIAFYRTGHQLLSATNIIMNDADRIKDSDKKLPADLKLGDFVVVREADKDIIKEIADVILERSGKTEHRALATKWKEALEIEQLFYTNDQIYENLVKAGCKKGPESVYRWLSDDNMIAPQEKEDLKFIAKVTGSTVLKEMLDQIYDAAQTVRVAHSKAGKILSETLKARIVEALDQYGDIDPFNIWEPIEMQVDGIGTVRILKIIDIGSPVIVDKADTNRLIDEE